MSNTPRTFVGTTTFRIEGMSCGHCVRAVTSEISEVDGVRDVSVDLASGLATVTAARPVDRADVASAVEEAGCRLQP